MIIIEKGLHLVGEYLCKVFKYLNFIFGRLTLQRVYH